MSSGDRVGHWSDAPAACRCRAGSRDRTDAAAASRRRPAATASQETRFRPCRRQDDDGRATASVRRAQRRRGRDGRQRPRPAPCVRAPLGVARPGQTARARHDAHRAAPGSVPVARGQSTTPRPVATAIAIPRPAARRERHGTARMRVGRSEADRRSLPASTRSRPARTSRAPGRRRARAPGSTRCKGSS